MTELTNAQTLVTRSKSRRGAAQGPIRAPARDLNDYLEAFGAGSDPACTPGPTCASS